MGCSRGPLRLLEGEPCGDRSKGGDTFLLHSRLPCHSIYKTKPLAKEMQIILIYWLNCFTLSNINIIYNLSLVLYRFSNGFSARTCWNGHTVLCIKIGFSSMWVTQHVPPRYRTSLCRMWHISTYMMMEISTSPLYNLYTVLNAAYIMRGLLNMKLCISTLKYLLLCKNIYYKGILWI